MDDEQLEERLRLERDYMVALFRFSNSTQLQSAEQLGLFDLLIAAAQGLRAFYRDVEAAGIGVDLRMICWPLEPFCRQET